jgi:predicted nucleic acid-binding protein
LSRTLLLDANVLLLLLVGRWNRARIETFKNTDTFTKDDFDLLWRIVGRFNRLVTTPHVLTEVSNLAGQHGEPERKTLLAEFATLIALLPEQTESAATASADPVFQRLGLTDAVIIALAATPGFEVLTTDLDLWSHLSGKGLSAWNFNHLRQGGLLP